MTAYTGVRIVDFTQGVAGPMAAMILGDLGADVVKVEPPGGDRLRSAPGWLAFNRNKQVLTLDLATAGGMAEAMTLIAGADVAIFDHAPSRLAALGLGADRLTAACPALIHAWMPPYGVEGALSELPPDHSLLAAATGWGWRQAAEGDRPVCQLLPVAWYGQAVMGATAIGAALFERRRSGRGQGLVVSGLHGFAEVGGPSRILKETPRPRSIPFGVNPRYRLYRCSDGGFFFLAALFDNFYRKVFAALGHSDVADLLIADDEGTRNLLDEVFASRPRDEWIALLQANGVPCAPVGAREAWFAGSAVQSAGLRLTLDHPDLGAVAMPGPAVALSDTPARAPSLPRPIAEAPAWAPRTAGTGPGERPAPLAGVRVLNLGTVIAGAYPSAILSYFGADVVKVEPTQGDPFRNDPTFLAYNRGARALALDLKSPQGRDVFLELVRQVDVVVDNYRLGVRSRLGIDYPALQAINPRIISCSVTAYGDKGPRAGRPGFDPLLQAEGGMMAAQGGQGDPVFLTVGVDDVAAAGMVSASVMAALNVRERTGRGQEVRTSLTAMSLLFQTAELVTYPGRPPNETGGWDCVGSRALQRYYGCRDGWIAIACERAAEAAACAQVLGLEVGDPQAALTAPRDGVLARRLEAALAQRPRAPLLAALHEAGVAATAVLTEDEALESDWLWRHRYLERWEHPVRGPVIGVGGYGQFLATPCAFSRPAPERGEHSREVLGEFGVSPDRITALIDAGTVFART
jgi:crotonobetainyl-CoA:carnitine CoA-transferase CaiB-like acyl-CoA transferase